jgi:hypothetical protein
VHDNALEFLEQVLPMPLRTLVIPLFDRAVSARDRARMADRLLGVALGSSDDAVEVLSRSHDPWLQACAAYAIGELKVFRLASAIDAWMESSDPLLRATAETARAKLKEGAAVPSLDVG